MSPLVSKALTGKMCIDKWSVPRKLLLIRETLSVARHLGQWLFSVMKSPTLPLAVAFRDACLKLEAEMAIFSGEMAIDESFYIWKEWLRDQYVYLVNKDVDGMLRRYYGLLYLNRELTKRWPASYWGHPEEDRDVCPVEKGYMIFGHQGRYRW